MESIHLIDSGSSTPESWPKSHKTAIEDAKEINSESDHASKGVEARLARAVTQATGASTSQRGADFPGFEAGNIRRNRICPLLQ